MRDRLGPRGSGSRGGSAGRASTDVRAAMVPRIAGSPRASHGGGRVYRRPLRHRDCRYIGSIHRIESSPDTPSREEPRWPSGSGVLELAVLGLLHESPMHGYELRKRLTAVLGAFRALSYGSLYPCLKDAASPQGWIAEDTEPADAARPVAASARKIVYQLTADGKEHFQDLLAEAGPAAWEDESFGVHFAFFGRTDADDPAAHPRGPPHAGSRSASRTSAPSLARTRERLDGYTLELQQHGLESVEREVRWLERADRQRARHASAPPQRTGRPAAATHHRRRRRATARPPSRSKE